MATNKKATCQAKNQKDKCLVYQKKHKNKSAAANHIKALKKRKAKISTKSNKVFVVTVDSLNYLQVLGDFVNYPSAPTDFVGGTSGLYFNISIDRKKAKSTLFFTPKQGEQPVFDIWGNMYVPI